MSKDGNVQLGIVFLHITRSILGTEFLNHRRNLALIRDRNTLEISLLHHRVDPNGRVLEQVLVPLCVRASHRQKAKRAIVTVTNQTGWEMVRPDFLPVTLMLISRDWDRRSFKASLRASLLLILMSFSSGH